MTEQQNQGRPAGLNLADTSKFKPMVQWFSPVLLARAGFRSMIASLFGQYADQRVIQHLSDPILTDIEQGDENGVFSRVASRYDYSTETVGGEPYWFDFTADLGDGFDPTYAVCHTIAQQQLFAENDPKKASEIAIKDWHGAPLPGGRLLVLGGDEIYPFPSHEEYEHRFSNPFRLALPGNDQPDGNGKVDPARRDLFAIPGNHDWYDGLAAFKDLFMAAEDGPLRRDGRCIGGWRTRQHRSYFAIKLPYNWWIWGADIHLNRSLDEGQIEYFRAISKTMGPGHKFILCTAQPTWYYFGTSKETLARENLRSLVDAPIRAGAKICGIFSGDSHHYARYCESDELGNFNLFTVGGGGAYTHGTHHLRPEIKLDWIGRLLDFKLHRKLIPGNSESETPTTPKPSEEPAVFPTKTRSKMIAWASALMPFRNWSFAAAIGFIYLLLTWSFAIITVEYDPQVVSVDIAQKSMEKIREKTRRVRGAPKSDYAPRSALEPQPDGAEPDAKLDWPKTDIIGQQIFDLTSIFDTAVEKINEDFSGLRRFNLVLSEYGTMTGRVFDVLLLGLAYSPIAVAFLLGLWVALISIAESKFEGGRGTVARILSGTLHFFAHFIGMWFLFCLFIYLDYGLIEDWFQENGVNRLFGIQLAAWLPFLVLLQMIIFGGILGGIIFGLYLAIGYRFFGVNADWTFSSQSLTRFKSFLRMSIEPDKLTIYPIGLDYVPTRTGLVPGWREREAPENGEPKLEPKVPLTARLIEGPIEIRVDEVRNVPRPPA